ncbi:hypothetical protein ASC77_19025 [Nocardioides sp. Root1257]|uniref:DUF1707 SHOCT-like domain-containing protein n=1 Tax=unclassified Nocardioides TaxID=2615069 RepID=UPI0006FC3B49|nr:MULTISPECIES: DUF1707 domain-containing protein [unclassified Nocardioides]KQW45999.1 hypothetical protein ASC77_19025 [Nocardioides sp. Root1257]KRC43262.1 hypothetical protein ASE24_19990 [Nocardioides sp. Root224]
MEGDLQPRATPDPTLMRISDAERHQVAEILRTAAGDGRIDMDELDERLEAAYAARTYADLVPITSDLPTGDQLPWQPPALPSPVVQGPASESHLAILNGLDRKGVWVVPRRMSVFAMMGGADLDLRQAKFAAQEVVITVNAFMGGAQITVGPHTHVVMEGTGIMGGYSGPSEKVPAELDANSPTVRIRGVAIWGGVSVDRKPMPGEKRRRRARR